MCEKHRLGDDFPGGVLDRDHLVYAGHVADPESRASAYGGWLVVEPVRHVPGLDGLTKEEAGRLGVVANRLARAQREVLGTDHVSAFILGGAPPSWRTPDHLHRTSRRYPDTSREETGARRCGVGLMRRELSSR